MKLSECCCPSCFLKVLAVLKKQKQVNSDVHKPTKRGYCPNCSKPLKKREIE
jgi:hypothetical protein